MEGIELAVHLSSCIVKSASFICEGVQKEGDRPCATCISNAEMMHAEFLGDLGIILRRQATKHQDALPLRHRPVPI